MKFKPPRLARYSFLALCATLLSLWAWHLGWRWGNLLDGAVHDVAFDVRPKLSSADISDKLPRSKDIIFVSVPPEMPRSLLADLISRLSKARVVALDLTLTDRAAALSPVLRFYAKQKGDVARWSKEDEACARAMKKANNVLVGIWPERSSDGSWVWMRPAPLFERNARALAHFSVSPDEGDGIVRRLPLWVRDGVFSPTPPAGSGEVVVSGGTLSTPTPGPAPSRTQKLVPALSLAAVALAHNQKPSDVIAPDTQRTLWINFLAPYSVMQQVANYYVPEAVLTIPSNQFEDAIVVVGQTEIRSKDVLPTPYGDAPGALVHAQAIATLLDARGLPTELSFWPVALLSLGASLLLGVALLRYSLLVCAFIAGGEALALSLLVVGLWAAKDVVAPLSVPLLAVFLTYNLLALSEYARTRDLVSLFLGRTMSRRVTDAAHAPTPGGKEEVATAFFCDLRGYSAWAQSRTPQQLIAALNDYTASVVQIIERSGGRVIDFFGDGVFVLFEGPEHARRAVEAALVVARELQGGKPQEGRFDLRVGVALHTGPMIVGYVGHPRHLKPGAVGDAVNVAARVQSLSDEYGYGVLLSRDTFEAWRTPPPRREDDLEPVFCGARSIKGHEGELELFGLFPLDTSVHSKIREHL